MPLVSFTLIFVSFSILSPFYCWWFMLPILFNPNGINLIDQCDLDKYWISKAWCTVHTCLSLPWFKVHCYLGVKLLNHGGLGTAPLVVGSKDWQPLTGYKGQSPWLGSSWFWPWRWLWLILLYRKCIEIQIWEFWQGFDPGHGPDIDLGGFTPDMELIWRHFCDNFVVVF